MPSTPESPTQEANEANDTFDIIAELESITNSVAVIDNTEDPPNRLRAWSPPQSGIEFQNIYRDFHSILHIQADSWSLVTRESALLLSQEIINNPTTFQSTLPSLLFPQSTTLYFVNVAIRKECILAFIPTPIPQAGFESATAGLRDMIASALRGVAYSYLTRVWRAVVSLLQSPRISTFQDHFFSLLLHAPHEFLTGDSVAHFDDNTTWDPRFGYKFLHVWYSSDRISWFANPAVQYMLHQLLGDMSSGVYINIPQVYLNQTRPQEPTLINPDSVHVSERVAFALAWIVVEMRALALPSYIFRHSPILTPERAECVMHELTLFNGLFNHIMDTLVTSDEGNAEIFVARREALRQLFLDSV